MVSCIKCGKELGRRSSSKCEYEYVYDAKADDLVKAEPEHVWWDRGEFIDELREKLPPIINEHIEIWKKKYAENQAEFNARLKSFNKKLDKIQAAYAVYLNEGLPRDVKKKNNRLLLGHVIGLIIGGLFLSLSFLLVFFVFKWILSGSILETYTPFLILLLIVIDVFVLRKGWKSGQASRDAESQKFADELVRKWRENNELDLWESIIEDEKDKWNNTRGSFERCIHDAERALVGSDEELLSYYNTDKQAKNWYIKNIYEGEW
jgi:hypothetical protein